MIAMNPKLMIRSACDADFDAWFPLWQGYQTFYKTNIADAVTTKTWERFLDPAEPMYCALAEQNGKVVGMVHYIVHRSCWTTGDYVYLQDLFVDSNARGQGIGKALIEHVYTQARELNASRVWWLTHESNTNAMVLYDQIADQSGFIQYRKIF
jgi:GNAT superfamily N-acetyltransferase